jgi:hypothetical protein
MKAMKNGIMAIAHLLVVNSGMDALLDLLTKKRPLSLSFSLPCSRLSWQSGEGGAAHLREKVDKNSRLPVRIVGVRS